MFVLAEKEKFEQLEITVENQNHPKETTELPTTEDDDLFNVDFSINEP